MKYREFGSEKKPVVIMLHGGGLSWWSLMGIVDVLKDQYRVITPIIDGHGEAGDTTFISIEESAQKLISYVDLHHEGKVFAMTGLSIGAQILTEVLSLRPEITKFAIIESALLFPMRGITALTVPMVNLTYGLVKKRWFAKIQAETLFVPDGLFEQYYQDSFKISKQSLINITLSNGNYSVREEISATKAKVMVIVGGKELGVMKRSARKLHEMIKGSQLCVMSGMKHGEVSLVHQKEYIQLMKTLFSTGG